uniref:Ras-GEF domain-containing protein n=1 Tax=Steinernema glaseri TaxID=37863 RepID=A0A1I8ATP7_9BILA
MTLFHELQRLCDPTKNMTEYRRHLAEMAQRPPVIPVLPFLCKDLFFSNDANATWTKKLVNFSKFRMISSIIRNAYAMLQEPESEDQVPGSVRSWKKLYEEEEEIVRINEYLDYAYVVQCDREQEQLSLDCEPRRKPVRTPSSLSSKSSQSISSSGRTSVSSPWLNRRPVDQAPVAPPPPSYNERLI